MASRTLDDAAHEYALKLIDRVEDLSMPGCPGLIASAAYALAKAMQIEGVKHCQPTTIPIPIGSDFVNG